MAEGSGRFEDENAISIIPIGCWSVSS